MSEVTISWSEIRSRAISFVKDWEGETRERAEKDSFWNDFFNVFGISRRRVASFEEPVKKLNNNYGFIDLFWKGKLLIEHKSKGKDLDKAYTQALDYFEGLKERDLPKYILVSDFDRFKLYNLDNGKSHDFKLSEFVDHIKLFGFIAGREEREFREEAPVNIKAAEQMGKLHDRLIEIGYEGHQLEVFLVRLLFCLFADDTGIFNNGIFQDYIEQNTKEDGSDLASHLAQLFQILDTPQDKRLKNLDDSLAQFPYVNGALFEENIPFAHFDSEMRELLLDAGSMDWGAISPAIFGSLFQAAMEVKKRRDFGAHYTSEKNIMKVIKPLFLDQLWEEFNKLRKSIKTLQKFHDKLASLDFLDPACGSGNFLIITYRELRLLELAVIREMFKIQFKGMQADYSTVPLKTFLKVSISQFHGIEIDEFAAKVAEVGMWLIEHQINEKVSLEFGKNIINLPLVGKANIVHANALRIDWEDVVAKDKLNYILGNPPFYGKQYQSKEQKEDLKSVFNKMKGAGVLDFVCGWYALSSRYIQNTKIEVAFVSTNSISQGEQTGILWNYLFEGYNVKINFAHRTFQWNNKAKGKAAVHCVIIGFANFNKTRKLLFEYNNIREDPYQTFVSNINPYLVEAKDQVVISRNKPISSVQEISYGSMANDGGNLILSDQEKIEMINAEPKSEVFIKPFLGSYEFINKVNRWCIWLKDVDPRKYKSIKSIIDRVNKVKIKRLSSSRENTRKLATFPMLFGEIRQPESDYLLIPGVSSISRTYIPIGF